MRSLFISAMNAAASAALLAILLPGATHAAPGPPDPGPWGWAGGIENPNRAPGRPSSPDSSGDEDGRGATAPAAGNAEQCPGSGPGENCTDLCGPLGGIAACQPEGGAGAVPAVTPVDLLQRALYELRLPRPNVRTAPPRDPPPSSCPPPSGSSGQGRCPEGYVGLAQWFWLDSAQRRPVTVREAAGGVWVELTASPQRLTITPGVGLAPVRCPGGGLAHTSGARPQSSACVYTYTDIHPAGSYWVTATASWGGTWRGSGGVGGALTPIAVSSSFSLRIAEGQALNGGGQ